MQRITHIQGFGGGYHVHGITDNGVEDYIPINEIRGAITPPTSECPGYYLIMGQKKRENNNGKNPALFIFEREDESIDKLFDALTDDIVKFKVRILYADKNKAGFFSALMDHFWNKLWLAKKIEYIAKFIHFSCLSLLEMLAVNKSTCK